MRKPQEVLEEFGNPSRTKEISRLGGSGAQMDHRNSWQAFIVDTRINTSHAGLVGSTGSRFMTATDFSKLADLIQEDSLPRWFREQVEEKSAEILRTLKNGKSITLHGPQGEAVTIGPANQETHTAA
jgi:hypothetical protein